MEDDLDQVFERNFEGRDVERVRTHRVHKNKEEEAVLNLDHPNIVKHFCCGTDDDYIYYELEPCVASLDQLFLDPNDSKKYNGPMPHHIDALLQLASGLEYIHSKNLVHGDIKPENVLISVGSGGQDEVILKWTKFGLIRDVSERGTGSINQTGGDKAWLSPELLLSLKLNSNVEENNCKANAKSDVYAQGLVFGSLFLNGEHLYGSMENENEIPQNIIKGNPINMQKIDGKLRVCYENDLLKKILERDPDKRMTSTQVVNQLKDIKNKIAGKEKELLELCGRDSRSDLTEKIKNLIQFGINLNAKDDGGRNALHRLCRNYSSPKLTDAIQLVIKSGIDMNARDSDGMNAIHYLCRYHSSQNLIEAIEILIQSGTDAKATTNDGSNALHYLCRYNASPNLPDATKILTKLGLDLMTEDNDGWSAFYYLQNKDKKEMKIWFDRDSLLGSGAFGMVFKGKFGGREVAVKRVELHRANKREEEAMLKLDHPNIVKLLHCEKDNNFMYYAFELCDASLDQLFLKSDNPKKYKGPMPRLIEVFSQLAAGLEHIHSKQLIHRNINPSNILIVQSPGKYEEIIIKWSGFALAESVNEKGLHFWTGVGGTRTWYAPEVLEKFINEEKVEEEEFWGTVKSDVFVLGLVFGYLFLNGEHLYGSNVTEIHKNIIGKNPVNMQKIDEKLRQLYDNELLRKMLENDPQIRITSKEVVEKLNSISKKLTEKEEELRRLCANDSSSGVKEKINDLIQLGIDVNARDGTGQNALHYLCRYNSNPNIIYAIRLLIQLGIDVNARDGTGLNALHYLCLNKSNSNLIDAIRLLIQLGIDVNAKDEDGCTALHHLCRNNSNQHLVDAIKVLIELGIDKDAKMYMGWNALHVLCYNNKSPHLIYAIKVLIELGIDKNAKDEGGWNALDYLSANQAGKSDLHIAEAIKILTNQTITEFSQKKNYGEYEDENFFKFAEEEEKLRQMHPQEFSSALPGISGLSIHDDNVNTKDKGKRNALHILCQSHSSSNLIKEIKRLIELGYKVNDKDKDGRNALHYLCQDNSSSNLVEAIKLFIENRIDMNAKDNDEWNALHYLCRFNSSSDLRDVIQILIQHGIDVKEKTDDGCNALHFLCQNHSTSNLIGALQVLIQHGINVNEKNNNGWNALSFLIRNSSMDKDLKADVFRFLIRHGIQVHCENEESSDLYQEFFKENGNCGKICFDFLVEEGIRFGWHDGCEHCQQILSIGERPRLRLQHHQMFSSCYLVLDSLMEDLEKWAKSIQKSGESELDIKNPTQWLREKAAQYQQSETEKRYKENFEVMAEVSEQVKDVSNSNHFNCDNYERYLRSMYSIAEMTGSKESMGHIQWFYLLPFDFPIDYDNEKEPDIKRAKIEWDKTLFSWIHKETDKHYGEFMKEDANEGVLLPNEFKHKCHEIDGKSQNHYAEQLLREMLETNANKRMTSTEIAKQMKSIQDKLYEKEEELRQLCATDFSPALMQKIRDITSLGIDVNAMDKDGRNALHYLCQHNSSSTLIDAVKLLIQLGIRTISNDHDARSILRQHYKQSDIEEIIELLDNAVLGGPNN